MVRLGIDFGTTNVVAALADRGNFPVLPLGAEGRPAIPGLVAWNGAEVLAGNAAAEVAASPGWDAFPSPKRWAGVPEPDPLQDFGGSEPGPAAGRLEEMLTLLFDAVRGGTEEALDLDGSAELEAVIGVPANANSLQRLRTLQAAERAGFRVLSLLHEPTAAAIEYAHRHPGFGRSKARRHLAVYDLGGGTFDAAVIACTPDRFEVVRSGGVERLGGDDFDRAMAEIALGKIHIRWTDLPWPIRHRLLLQCRDLKEALRPTTRKWTVDLSELNAGDVSIGVDEFAEAAGPQVDRTIARLEEVLGESGVDPKEVDALLLVGGGSELPLVRRRLREVFGTRLKLAPDPFAATAVGLAIQAERTAEVTERFSRCFGVWRERDGGAAPAFDAIFDAETPLPPPGERTTIVRSYRPAHDVGHFRFEECGGVEEGEPVGDRTPWCEIRFPFDPTIAPNERLEERDVRRNEAYSFLEVEERYECDSAGMIRVSVSRRSPPLSRSFLLYGPEQVAPIAVRRGRKGDE